MPSFEEIDEARRLLGLGDAATLNEIRERFRRLALRHHPDRCQGDDKSQSEDTMKKLNQAYKLLIRYCAEYKYPFREEDVDRTYPYEAFLRKHRQNWTF